MTNNLVVFTNSIKGPKIKKILLYELKFLVPNYSCLENLWPEGLPPTDPRSLRPLSSTEFVEHPQPEKNSWVRHWIYEIFSATTDACSRTPAAPAPSTVTWHCTLHSHCKLHRMFICWLKVPQSLGVCLVTFC